MTEEFSINNEQMGKRIRELREKEWDSLRMPYQKFFP